MNIEKIKLIKAQHSNENITQGGGYEDLAIRVGKYIKEGMELTLLKGTAKYDTALGYLIKENAPKRKFRYSELEVNIENKKWQQNFEAAKKAANEKLREMSQAKHKEELEKYYQERRASEKKELTQ